MFGFGDVMRSVLRADVGGAVVVSIGGSYRSYRSAMADELGLADGRAITLMPGADTSSSSLTRSPSVSPLMSSNGTEFAVVGC